MIAILAVTTLTLRALFHHRVMAWLSVISIAIAAILPFTTPGTDTETLRFNLSYLPGLTFTILLLATVGISGWTINSERHLQRLALLATKPLRPVQLWLGKWFAILLVNTLMLAITALLFCITLPASAPDAEQTLKTTWLSTAPNEDPTLQARALQLWQQQTNAPSPAVYARILNDLKFASLRIAPGQTRNWQVAPLTANGKQQATAMIQFKFIIDPFSRAPVSGTWLMTASNTIATSSFTNLLDGTHTLAIPEPLPNEFYTQPFTLIFSNAASSRATMFLDTDQPVTLRTARGSMAINLFAAATFQWVLLAAAAAITLTLGSLFSFPVAVFAMIAFILATTLSASFSPDNLPAHHHHQVASQLADFLTTPGEWLLPRVNATTRSLRELLPFNRLAQGQYNSLAEHSCPLLCLFAAALPCLLIAAAILNQREKDR